MKFSVLICLVCLSIQAAAQVKGDLLYIHGSDTTHVPFLYLGHDTLDYADGGCTRTAVTIASVQTDSTATNRYSVEGVLSDGITGEDLAQWGEVFLGRIRLIKARTWIGEGTTGLLVRESPPVHTAKGRFTISVPRTYDGYLILTTLGGIVIDLPFQDVVTKHAPH